MTFVEAKDIWHNTLSNVDVSFYHNRILKSTLPNSLPTAKGYFHGNPDLASNPSKIKAMESYKEADLYRLGQGGRVCDL